MITRYRQTKTGIARQRQNILDRTFAKAPFAHDQATMMILQSACDNFRCRCRTGVNQHNYRSTARYIAWNRAFRPPALDVAFVAATLRNDLATVEKCIGDRHGFIKDTAWIGAQIQI